MSGTNLQSTRTFWHEYYGGQISGDNVLEEQPSPFALAVRSKLTEGSTLLEIGCGNGRDSCYFAASGISVIATDICETAVKLTAKKLPPTSVAMAADSTGLPDVDVDYAYARFVLHALTVEEQGRMLAWMKKHVRRMIFIETRSLNDPRCGKGKKVGTHAYVDTHYRRFMSVDELESAAARAGFENCEIEETDPGSGNDGARVLRATIRVISDELSP